MRAARIPLVSDDGHQTSAIIVAILAVFGGMIAHRYSTHRVLRRYLRGRERIVPSAFGTRYYADPGKSEIATFVLEQMQELAGVDFTGAAPADRINADLRLDEIDSLANVELITRVEERFQVHITDEEAAHVATIGEVVDLVHSKRAFWVEGRA